MVTHNTGKNICQEQKTVSCMIQLYCHQHHSGSPLCDACLDLQNYALKRLTLCRYGEQKTTCEKCPRHCYHSDYKKKIKKVMRYSGPRMMLHHPIMAIRHLFKNIRK